MAAVRSSGGGRTGLRRRPARPAPVEPRRRSSSTSASGRIRGRARPRCHPHRSASRPSGSTPCRATGRSRRSARVAIARASPRRCSARGFDRVNAVRGGLPDWEARGFPSPTAALRMLARGLSWLRAARVTRTRRCGSAPRSAHPDPNAPSAATPSRTASSTTTTATADHANTLPTRPLRWSPISRWSFTSRTMNTSTSRSPWRFCDAMISGNRSSPG